MPSADCRGELNRGTRSKARKCQTGKSAVGRKQFCFSTWIETRPRQPREDLLVSSFLFGAIINNANDCQEQREASRQRDKLANVGDYLYGPYDDMKLEPES